MKIASFYCEVGHLHLLQPKKFAEDREGKIRKSGHGITFNDDSICSGDGSTGKTVTEPTPAVRSDLLDAKLLLAFTAKYFELTVFGIGYWGRCLVRIVINVVEFKRRLKERKIF